MTPYDRDLNLIERSAKAKSSTIIRYDNTAKEAVVKAFGVGFRGIYPSDISMQKNELGKPELINQKLENIKHHLSITNTDSYTLSFVVLEK